MNDSEEIPWVDLVRFRQADEIADVSSILKDTGIPFKTSGTSPVYDITAVGSGSNGDVLMTVPAERYEDARKAMEAAYVSQPIPPGHFLSSATDEDLIEVLSAPDEWSAFDVAHARRLAGERGVNGLTKRALASSADVSAPLVGKKAPRWLIWFGAISAFLGGVVGIAIGWSLMAMKERTVKGEFYTYDEQSRSEGQAIVIVGVVALLCVFILTILL